MLKRALVRGFVCVLLCEATAATASTSVAVSGARRRLIAQVPQHHHTACDACCACHKYTEFSSSFCRFAKCPDDSGLWCWDPDPWSMAEWGDSCTSDLGTVTKHSNWGQSFPKCAPPPQDMRKKWAQCRTYYKYLRKQGVHGKALFAFHTKFWRDVCGEWVHNLVQNVPPVDADYCYFRGDKMGYHDKMGMFETEKSGKPMGTKDAHKLKIHHIMEERAHGCPPGEECENDPTEENGNGELKPGWKGDSSLPNDDID